MIAVYIHIPYCRTICPYCDFVKEPIRDKAPSVFVDTLCREITHFGGPGRVLSVFLGGGTPSLVEPHDLARIMSAIQARFEFVLPEITVEANPDDVTPELVERWHGLGVNRVSLGVQSFDEQALRYLGRRHDAHCAHRACDFVAERFDTWSLDLMFGVHPAGAWGESLRQAIAHQPPHVSAYGLTYEPGTPFGKRANEAIDDDAYLDMYTETVDTLGAAGILRYEISNFARPGHECRHNLVYWHNQQYAGFGTGAYSFIDGVRARNHESTDRYLDAPGEKSETLPLSDYEIRLETVIQELRLVDGLSRTAYLERFGNTVDGDFGPVLDQLVTRGLLVTDGDRIRPTALGFDLNNEIGLALVGEGAERLRA